MRGAPGLRRAQLAAGVTQATIHARLVREKGLEASVASLRRWVAAHLPEEARAGAGCGCRGPPVPPGSGGADGLREVGEWTLPGSGGGTRC